MTDKIVVLSTCGSPEEGEKIARALVERRLAVCVNVLPGARSIYWWKGAVEEAAECLLVIKTTRECFERLRAEFPALHSYDLPELVALPVVDGLEAYLSWIGDSTGPVSR